MTILGYARVSTQDQKLTGQLEALKASGATTIYREKVSGARADRPQLAKLMAALKPDDVVVVTKLDRLGRSTRELLELIDRIGKAGASFRSLGDPLWDGHATVLPSPAMNARRLVTATSITLPYPGRPIIAWARTRKSSCLDPNLAHVRQASLAGGAGPRGPFYAYGHLVHGPPYATRLVAHLTQVATY